MDDRDPPQTWLIGYRHGIEIGDAETTAPSAADAADLVRESRPGCVIAAVFPLQHANHPAGRSVFSDLPETFRPTRRFRSANNGEHGFVIVSVWETGERSLIPDRPISFKDAVWRRDWLLRHYFEQLVAHRQGRTTAPIIPIIAALTPA